MERRGIWTIDEVIEIVELHDGNPIFFEVRCLIERYAIAELPGMSQCANVCVTDVANIVSHLL